MIQRKFKIWLEIDWLTIAAYLALVIFGLLNIYSAVYQPEHPSLFDMEMRYGKQVIWVVLAFVFALVIFLIDARFYQFIAYPFYLIMIFLLIAVVLFGTEVNGARSWFQAGAFRIQPAEFGKVAVVLTLAKFLSTFNIQIHSMRTLTILVGIVFLPALLIFFQNDTGSALVYFALIFTLYREGLTGYVLWIGLAIAVLFVFSFIVNPFYIALIITAITVFLYYQDRKSVLESTIALLTFTFTNILVYIINEYFDLGYQPFFLVAMSTLPVAIIFLAYAIWKRIKSAMYLSLIIISSIIFLSSVDFVFNEVMEKHQQTRILVLLGLKEDPKGAGYNVNQSKIAIGSGGFSGKGFLEGTQTKYDFVPEQSTDFIFCTVGEEWGFLGTTSVILIFVFLLLRLIVLAERQRSNFNRIVGWGVISILFFHFSINILMTIGLAPVIGIPLPFFSYGGSSLWAFTILLFIFLKLDSTRKEFLQ
ncbi:MAG: rod shape-determining protein RodA [Bacteroidales bacterium]|nr:rod shape-determining protein RodA [Bacteroidales bacterium]